MDIPLLASLKTSLTLTPGPLDASSGRSAHGFVGTEVDESSHVINGNVHNKPSNKDSAHLMSGGSITNGSQFVNGDMDSESFEKWTGNR